MDCSVALHLTVEVTDEAAVRAHGAKIAVGRVPEVSADPNDPYSADLVASSTERALATIFGNTAGLGVARIDGVPGMALRGRFCTPGDVRTDTPVSPKERFRDPCGTVRSSASI